MLFELIVERVILGLIFRQAIIVDKFTAILELGTCFQVEARSVA